MPRISAHNTDTTAPPPALLRPREAAKLLAISQSKIYALMAEGAIPVLRSLGHMRIARKSLDEFIDQSLNANRGAR